MVLLAILLFIAAEIVVFVVVAQHIGILLAVVLVLAVSAAGPFLLRRAGTGVVDDARQRILAGQTPDREVLDGVVLLLGGIFVCVPGFITDALGLLLLIGPVRHAIIRLVGRRLARRVGAGSIRAFVVPGFSRRSGVPGAPGGAHGPIVDAPTHDRDGNVTGRRPVGPPHEADGPLRP